MRRTGLTDLLVQSMLAIALPVVAVAQSPVPAGGEFQVNSYTTYAQFQPQAGMDADGDFVVTWPSDNGQDGEFSGVFAKRFNAAGVPQAVEFQVNVRTSGTQDEPVIAMRGNGDFVVVWQSYGQDGSAWGLFGRRFNSAGSPQAGEFQVNAFTTGNQYRIAMAMDGAGDFVVVWESYQDGLYRNVVGRRFNAAATPQATEFVVALNTVTDQDNPDVAMDADGDFVVVWEEYGPDGDRVGALAQRFDSTGAVQGGPFVANSYTKGDQQKAAVAMDAAGDFVVVWQSYAQDGSLDGIFAQPYDAAGTAQASEFQVNAYATSVQNYPDVAMETDGDFTVTWQSYSHDGGGFGVFVRSFDSAGTPSSAELQVNSYTPYYQRRAAIDMDGDGDFVVAWQGDNAQDGDAQGVFAQRFVTPIALDVDGDGSFLPLTDGILVLRFAFGFRGATLITGAVGGGCTRCTAPAIEAFLDALTH